MSDQDSECLDAVFDQGHGVLIHLTEDVVEREEDIFREFFVQRQRISLDLLIQNFQHSPCELGQLASGSWIVGLPYGQLADLDAAWLELYFC